MGVICFREYVNIIQRNNVNQMIFKESKSRSMITSYQYLILRVCFQGFIKMALHVYHRNYSILRYFVSKDMKFYNMLCKKSFAIIFVIL